MTSCGSNAREMSGSSRPHIAVFVPVLGGGGAERQMLNLMNEFVRHGVKTDVLVADAEQSDYLSELSEEVRVISFDVPSTILSLPSLPSIISYLWNANPKVLVSVALWAHLAPLLACKIAGTNTRCVASVRNFHSREYKSGISFSRRIVLNISGYTLSKMDHVFAVTKRIRKDVIKNFGVKSTNVSVVNSPILDSDVSDRAQEYVEHPWFNDSDLPVLISVGRLTRQKNYPLLLRAFSEVRRQRHARLVVLGEGEERSSLERQARRLKINEDVDFVGFVDNPYAYMSKASLFVLASDWEGLQNVIVEALAVGCPVVSTDCPSGPREILDDGKYGRLVPTSAPESLAEAILEALRSTTDEEKLKARAQDFSDNAVADAYLRHLLDL